ncbi:hypothetical protein [Luteolibacter sp. AS25]|uniref:hypothetical protein n=1 Tax=Luteolibacter sp. AS25 TaxID=3135776 RepID=UPI00398A69B0
MSKNSTSDSSHTEIIPPAEWIAAGIGLTLLCVCIGFLFFKAFMLDGGVPKISFAVKQIVAQDGGSLVLGKVSNEGGETVTALHIRATSGSEQQQVEIDYLPARSSREFGVFFTHIPEEGSVSFTASGYQEP